MPSTSFRSLEDADGNELVVLPSGRLPDEEAQIGGQSTLTGAQLHNGNDGQGSPTDTSRDEKNSWREDLKADTGFGSYTGFLEAYEEGRLYLNDLRIAMRWAAFGLSFEDSNHNCCAIYDVHQRDSTNLKMIRQCCSLSARVIHSTLRQSTATGIFRVVLWDNPALDPDMLSVLGLGLKIQPGFFHAVFARNHVPDKGGKRLKERRLATNIVAMGQFVMTVARHGHPTNSNVIPVILISGRDSDALTVGKNLDETLPFEKPISQLTTKQSNLREQPSSWFEKSTSQLTTKQSNLREQPSLWMQDYVRFLEADFANGRRSDESDTDLILRSLNPLLRYQISTIREECHLKRNEYINFTQRNKEGDLGTLFRERSYLRRMTENSEDDFQHLQRLKFSQKGSHNFQDAASMIAEDDLRRAHSEASRLETEIRDYLQLQTGDLALRESIKSIELSNTQIEEAKRG